MAGRGWVQYLLVLAVIFSASYGEEAVPTVSSRRFMRRDDAHQPVRPSDPLRKNPHADSIEADTVAKELRYNRLKKRLDDTTQSFQRFSSIVAMAAEASEDPKANQLRGERELPLGHDPIDRIEALERRIQSLEFRGVDLQIVADKLLAEFEQKNKLSMEALEKDSQDRQWREEIQRRQDEENERQRQEAESHRQQLRQQYNQHARKEYEGEEDAAASSSASEGWQLWAGCAVAVIVFIAVVWILWKSAASWCARKPVRRAAVPPSVAPRSAAPLLSADARGTPPPPPPPAQVPQRVAQPQQFFNPNPGFEGELRNRALSRWDH